MALMFYIVAPAIFPGLTILLFQFRTSNFAKITAIPMAALPWIILTWHSRQYGV
jgi:hypothetical protein